jgi:CBS domain-containing protein
MAFRASLDEPVTKHMRTEGVCQQDSQSVGEALAWLRENPPAERSDYFYVVDGAGRLQGVVPTRHLVVGPANRPLAAIMNRRVVALPAAATVREACDFLVLHRFVALPVVDTDRRLLGVVDMELFTDELDTEALASLARSQAERASGGTKRLTAEWGVCLLCAEPLADGGWCNRCQLARDTVERIFREQRVEEARTPCAPLVILVLISLLAAAGLVVWAALSI